MIAQAKVKEAERLLADGVWSQRRIAKMVGISRAVVGAIAAGSRPDYESRRRARQEAIDEPLGPLGRCHGCGGLVYLPCRLCRVRSLKDQEQAAGRAERRRQREAATRQLLQMLREPPARHQDPLWPGDQRRVG